MTPGTSSRHRWLRRIGLLLMVVAMAVAVASVVSPNVRLVAAFIGKTVYGKFDEWRYQPTEVWRSGEWRKPNPKYRYTVLDYVVDRLIVSGTPQEDVRLELGPPDLVRSNGAWFYETKRPGMDWGLFTIHGLVIEFDEYDKVVAATEYVYVD